MKKLNRTNLRKAYYSVIATMTMGAMTCGTAFGKSKTPSTMDDVVSPIVNLIESLMGPALALVGALGSLYCVFLGVKFAKAEEPQEREKAKASLKGAVIGFVLIFVLLLALNLSMPVLQKWVLDSQVGGAIEF